jgi:hypothetical protein
LRDCGILKRAMIPPSHLATEAEHGVLILLGYLPSIH